MSLRQAAQEFANLGISQRVAARYAATLPALKSQMTALIKKIDGIDASAQKKEMQKHVSEITALGSKLEKELEKSDDKMEAKKLNRAIEYAMAIGSYGDKIMDAVGDSTKVDKLLGNLQGELKAALKHLG